MIFVLLLLGAVMLLLQLQSGAITLPAGKPRSDTAADSAPSTAQMSGDPALSTGEPDFAAIQQREDKRVQALTANQNRDYLAARVLTQMLPEAAAALLQQWPPEQAASALRHMQPRYSGPILEAAPSASAGAWLAALRQPEALPEVSSLDSEQAADAGLQPDESTETPGQDSAAGGSTKTDTTTPSTPESPPADAAASDGAGAGGAAPGTPT